MRKISLFTEVRGLDLSFDIKELSYHPHAHFKLLRGDFLQTRVFFWKIAQN